MNFHKIYFFGAAVVVLSLFAVANFLSAPKAHPSPTSLIEDDTAQVQSIPQSEPVQPTEPITEATTPAEPEKEDELIETAPFATKPFVKVGEDESNYYYQGYITVSGTYWRGSTDGWFRINREQEHLFPNLAGQDWNNGDKVLDFYDDSVVLLSQKTKIPQSNVEGDVCHVSGKATIIISNYSASKYNGLGESNEATIAKVLSVDEEKYLYWKRWPEAWKENPDCTEVNPYTR